MTQLNLTRPIIFFDIEATGLQIARDRIVELSYIKVFPDGREESKTLRFNPEMHISTEATAVNGIKDEDVADCDLAGFNSNIFDVPMLVEEFARAGSDFDITKSKLVDVQTIYHKLEPRNLIAAYKFYCNKDLHNAHTAMADTQATYEVLKAQLDKYGKELQGNVGWLSEFTRRNRNVDLAGRIAYDEQGTEVFNFGKYKGRAVTDILRSDPGYFSWIMQGDFTQNTKQTLLRIRLKAGL